MLKFVFDAGPLITACKFYVEGQLVIDHLLAHCQVVIPVAVYDEVVIAGSRFLDAQEAKRRVDTGNIEVATPVSNAGLTPILTLYGFGDGEQEAISLVLEDDFQSTILVVDDHLAYLVSDRLGAPKLFLLDLVVQMVREKQLTTSVGCSIVEAIRQRYPESFVEHTLLILEQLEGPE